jgi:hypothetical protein
LFCFFLFLMGFFWKPYFLAVAMPLAIRAVGTADLAWRNGQIRAIGPVLSAEIQ